MIAREHSINNIFFLKKKTSSKGRWILFCVLTLLNELQTNGSLCLENSKCIIILFFFVIVHINYRMYFVGPCPQLVFSILYIFTRLCDYYLAEYGIGRNQNYGK